MALKTKDVNKLQKEPKLSKKEQQAIDLLKSNIRDWLTQQLNKSKGLSGDPNLADIQETVFNQFEGKEKINPSRRKPLLMRALREVVAEFTEAK